MAEVEFQSNPEEGIGRVGCMPAAILPTAIVAPDSDGSDAFLLPELWADFAEEEDAEARVRHPSFQAGLRVMDQGSKHNPECPVATSGKFDHPHDCTCLKRNSRPGRRRETILVSESDLMSFPLKQLNNFIQDSGLADTRFVEYTRYLRDMWHRIGYTKTRLPDECCMLGCGHLKDFRSLIQGAGLTPNGARFLEEERERFMNRQQQYNSRQRRKHQMGVHSSPVVHESNGSSFSSVSLPMQLPIRNIPFGAGQHQQFQGNFPAFLLPQHSSVLPQLAVGMGSPSDIGRSSAQNSLRMSYPYTWPNPQSYSQNSPNIPLVMSTASQHQHQWSAALHQQQQQQQRGGLGEGMQTADPELAAAHNLSMISTKLWMSQSQRLPPTSPNAATTFYGPDPSQMPDPERGGINSDEEINH